MVSSLKAATDGQLYQSMNSEEALQTARKEQVKYYSANIVFKFEQPR